MDKRIFDKSSSFFKKEGFYVILFVCLCIVATVAAITARNNKLAKNEPPVVQEPKDTNLAANSDDTTVDIDNALQVKTPTTPSSAITVPKDGKSSVAVNKAVDTAFTKPVKGALVRPYTTETVYCATIGTFKTVDGVDIKTAAGEKVVAVLAGKVEKIANDNTELGQYVVINHQNGLKTVYANLDEKLASGIKVGANVTKGQQIGKVGKTRGSFSEETYGDHLHFQVKNSKGYVDPAKYVTYELAAKNQ